MKRDIRTLRNIGIIAHIDAGKTTVTEQMLFLSGTKHRAGRVDDGSTTTDDDPEEQQRGITIYSACVTFQWGGVNVNLLDTPGHVDFTAEVERCLRVLDGAVVVFSAREGVEAQSETVWRQADRYGVPRLTFINKMDREGADFSRVLQQMRQRLQANPIVLQIPYGQGPAHTDQPFRGVIDLIKQKLLTYKDNQVVENPIPDDMADEAQLWREQMLESLYDYSEEMAMLAMEEQPIEVALIKETLRKATLARQIQPLLCGSALHGMGVQGVLDAVADYLPSPADRPPVKGTDPTDKDRPVERAAKIDEPFCSVVFKILPAKTGDLYWIRVYSGQLKSNSRLLCPSKDKKENVAQLWQIHASKKERDGQIEVVGPGDIVCAIGPRYAVTGDTLCDTREVIQLESICFPEAVIEMAIEPESTSEKDKLLEVLEMLKRQDPTFRAKENSETGQMLIAGMGELHLEVIKHRLLRDFKLNVKVHKPRVSYRETIAKAVTVEGQCNRVINGQQLFAKVKLEMQPRDEITTVEVRSTVPPDKVPIEWRDAAISELNSRGQGGGTIGSFPLSKLRVKLIDAEGAMENSNEIAFTIAAADAFEKGLVEGGPVLLEPIMKLSISTPDEYYGDFIGDISKRRGRIVNSDNRGGTTFIDAEAPLAELFGYSNSMRSLSQGRAGASMEPLEYQPAPPEVAKSFAY